MPNTLRIKRRASGNAGAPTTSQCVNAELAFNEVDGILYYGKGGSDTASSSVIAIGAELATGVATFLKTPSSANLAAALTDESGSTSVVFSNSPTLVTPNIGTPSAGTLTNCTGLPISNGVSGLGTGVATFLATPSSANLAAALTDETGTALGSPVVVFSVRPTITSYLRVATGATNYTQLSETGIATYNASNDALRGSMTYNAAVSYGNPVGWAINAGTANGGGINFSETYGGTATPIRWVPGSGVLGETATWTTLSPATLPATYAAHPAGESGYGKINYSLKLPANSGELATTAYVASAIAAATGTSTSLKQAVAVATTANITLSGLQTIDGYTTVDGDRVLVKNQTTGSANGIYVAVAGAWARATDADTSAEISGASVFVQNGTTNGSKTFTCTTSSITLGTTALTFTDATTIAITAGNGLTLTGSTLDVGTASSSRIVVNTDNIDLATVGTAGTYAKVTTDAYGRVSSGSSQVAIGSDVSGLGTGVATFLGSPSSANLAAAVTDETGSGLLVFATSPVLTTPNIGTPSAGTLTSCTGLPISTGVSGLGTGVATFLGTPSSSNLSSALSDKTGTGVNVFGTSPTITTSIVAGSASMDIFNTTATTVNAFGAATTLSVGASTGTTTVNNNLTVTGNLTINGTTTTVNSTTVTIDDPIFTIGGDTAPGSNDSKDRGIEFRWHNGTAAKVGFFGYDASASAFTFVPDATNSSEVFSGTAGDVLFGKINKVTITAPASGATLTIADGKTLTANNSLTFAGTDSTTMTFPSTSATMAGLGIANAFTGANTFTNASGQTYRPAATQDGIVILGRAGGTSSYAVSLSTATLSANRTISFPDAAGTVVTTSTICTDVGNCTLDGGTF